MFAALGQIQIDVKVYGPVSPIDVVVSPKVRDIIFYGFSSSGFRIEIEDSNRLTDMVS